MKTDARNILFFVFLVLGVVLLVWSVFGNSPTEFIALATLILTVLLKVWTVSDRQIRLEAKFDSLEKGLKEHKH